MENTSPCQVSPTILLVEDEEGIRRSVAKMLQYLGYTVLAARDGRQALDIFLMEKETIDAVLLDWTLPEINGDRLLDMLLDKRPEAKILITSGHTEQEIEERYLMRAQGYIHKPYDLNQIFQALSLVLSSQSNDVSKKNEK